MASVEEVKANVAASVDGAGRAATGIRQVTDQLDDALALLRLTAIGSFHPSVASAIAQLEQARTRLDAEWRFADRSTFEAVVRIEFDPATADRIIAEHDGCTVDYAVNLWWRRY